MADTRSTLERGDEIEEDFYRLKAMEFGPASDQEEIKKFIEMFLQKLHEIKRAIEAARSENMPRAENAPDDECGPASRHT